MVPSPLKLYLECIGRVTDPFNITWVPGTVFFWSTTLSLDGFPCPNLSLLINLEKNPMPHLTLWKIEADMKYTLGSLDDPVWALPNKLINTPPAPWLHPNRHLLGYHPAEKLTSSQYLTLTRLGFRPPLNYPFQIIGGFPVHKGALKLVNRALRKITPKPYQFPIPQNLSGSLAQLPFAEWLQTPYNHNKDTNLEATIHSHFPFPLQVILLANLFRYRLCRANFSGQCGICFNWDTSFPRVGHSYASLARWEIDSFLLTEPPYLNHSRFSYPPEGDPNKSNRLLRDFVRHSSACIPNFIFYPPPPALKPTSEHTPEPPSEQ